LGSLALSRRQKPWEPLLVAQSARVTAPLAALKDLGPFLAALKNLSKKTLSGLRIKTNISSKIFNLKKL
jgi:hypothetical protein